MNFDLWILDYLIYQLKVLDSAKNNVWVCRVKTAPRHSYFNSNTKISLSDRLHIMNLFQIRTNCILWILTVKVLLKFWDNLTILNYIKYQLKVFDSVQNCVCIHRKKTPTRHPYLNNKIPLSNIIKIESIIQCRTNCILWILIVNTC